MPLMIDSSMLVQTMAWCHQATSHYLSRCWPVLWHHMASLGINELTHWPLGYATVKLNFNLQTNFSRDIFFMTCETALGICYRNSIMVSRHRFRWWSGVITQQVITWADVEQVLWHRMMSLSLNQLKPLNNLLQIFEDKTGTIYHSKTSVDHIQSHDRNLANFIVNTTPADDSAQYQQTQHQPVTHCGLADFNEILDEYFSSQLQWLMAEIPAVRLPLEECHKTLLMISQHWFR